VVLSEVLPYELPVSFSNSEFGELLSKLGITIRELQVTAKWVGPTTPAILSILFGGLVTIAPTAIGQSVTFLDPRRGKNIPLPRSSAMSYNIGKNAGGVRTVSLMHPRAQLTTVEFYKQYADTILYFTRRSPYSIRFPSEVARFTVTRDAVFEEDRDLNALGIEENDREYERLRSYFIYGGYSHIYKFHESAEVRRLERRYSRLSHVDVTRCFDSIYTHTISWVTNGLEHSKTMTRATADTFGGRFDKLLQCANDLETHGILIGPEVSRIFAEIILQEVDVLVERKLREAARVRHRHDYEIRRFVDDYFIFCDSEELAKKIITVLGDELKKFKLYLNEAKRTDETTPLASKRSVAKYKIKSSVRKLVEVTRADIPAELPRLLTSAEALLLEYKGVLLETGLDHGDLANYTLVQLEFAFEQALGRWRDHATGDLAPLPFETDWTGLARFISSIFDVAVSIFAGGVSASHSVKLARIAFTALKFMSTVGMPQAIRSSVESKIAAELVVHVKRPESETAAPVEALILLDALASMDVDGGLLDNELRELVNFEHSEPNAIVLLTALRYCRDRADLAAVRSELEAAALNSAGRALKSLDTNATLLASALLDSPFQTKKFKNELLLRLGLPASSLPTTGSKWVTFFHWQIPDYYEALQRKRGGEVY
jgi:hypothetical protein